LGVGKNASHGFPVTGQLSWIKAEQNCFRVCDTNFSSRSDVLKLPIYSRMNTFNIQCKTTQTQYTWWRHISSPLKRSRRYKLHDFTGITYEILGALLILNKCHCQHSTLEDLALRWLVGLLYK